MTASPKIHHLNALQTAAADMLRIGGPPAHGLLDLLDNGSEPTPSSVGEVLALVPQIDLPTRLQAAAAELNDAVERAHQAQPHAFDLYALSLARRTVGRVTTHLLTDDEWRALARGAGEMAPDLVPPRLALLLHGGVLEAADTHTRQLLSRAGRQADDAVSNGRAGGYALPEPALAERDLAYHIVPDLDLRLGLVLRGRAERITTSDLLGWYLQNRPLVFRHGVHMAGALHALGETPRTCCRRVHELLTEALRASGAVLLSLAVREQRSAVSQLAVSLVQTAEELAD